MYCQNHPWSQDYGGVEYDIDGLVAIFRGLADDGCHNWNLVSPTPWLPMITEALYLVRESMRAVKSLLARISAGDIQILTLTAEDAGSIKSMMVQYHDQRVGVADAGIVNRAERENRKTIFTT